MPLVRIEIVRGKDPAYKKTLLDAVHAALVCALDIPDWDRFQRLTEIDDACFERPGKTDRFTIIELTIFHGRTKEQKAAAFSAITEELHERLGIQPADVFIVIHEPPDENWGLGGKQRQS